MRVGRTLVLLALKLDRVAGHSREPEHPGNFFTILAAIVRSLTLLGLDHRGLVELPSVTSNWIARLH